MKKIIYLMLLSAFTVQSCKKDTVERLSESESFYPIGTVLKTSNNVIITDSIKASGKQSYYPYEVLNGSNTYVGGYSSFMSGSYSTLNGNNSVIARSSNNMYRLIFQTDGNLVLYNLSGKALWSSSPRNASRAVFQGDGNIVLMGFNYNNILQVTWSAGVTAGPNPIWVLQDDGNLVGYSNHTNNGFNSITITGPSFGATGTDGGKVSRWNGRIVK